MQAGLSETTVILRMLLALVSGGIIGYDRTMKGFDAGFRTHMIVCMSSCAIMLMNLHMYAVYGTGDPSRMPAQVISGVGFLGAGCILVTSQKRIKGVTTAAGVWASACIGLCIGEGSYVLSVFIVAAVYLTLTVFHSVEEKLERRTKVLRVYVSLESISALTSFIRSLQQKGIRVTDVETLDGKSSDETAVVMRINFQEKVSGKEAAKEFMGIDGVLFVTEL